eukprot:IDg13047t1
MQPLDLPKSARGAPEHIKQSIRRRQNAESARRSRTRRKNTFMKLSAEVSSAAVRIRSLEQYISSLYAAAVGSGMKLDSNEQARRKMPLESKISLPIFTSVDHAAGNRELCETKTSTYVKMSQQTDEHHAPSGEAFHPQKAHQGDSTVSNELANTCLPLPYAKTSLKLSHVISSHDGLLLRNHRWRLIF